jgi:hypothetical protein
VIRNALLRANRVTAHTLDGKAVGNVVKIHGDSVAYPEAPQTPTTRAQRKSGPNAILTLLRLTSIYGALGQH